MQTDKIESVEKENDQLKNLVNRIADLLIVEQIYETSIISCSGKKELFILVPSQPAMALAELKPIMNMLFEGYSDYGYRLFYVHQVKENLSRGNLLFYEVCQLKNQLYINPLSDYKLFTENNDAELFLVKAKQNFLREMNKVIAFNEGTAFYFEKQNYAIAAFMVHQQIELAYRAIELFAMGKDKVTHEIRVHQKHVSNYLPELAGLFDETNDAERKLMNQLDNAYLAVRYENDYQISKDKLLKAMEKGALIQKWVCQIHKNMLTVFEENHLIKTANDEPVLELEEIADLMGMSQGSNELIIKIYF